MKTLLGTTVIVCAYFHNCLGEDLEGLASQNLLGDIDLGLGQSSLLMSDGLGDVLLGKKPFFRRPCIETWNLQ